ncbi:hypothetical protein [Muriicola soli]|uniref:Uncharacterized protein n=1 Tax=Muriicola soli TaxID=2507538 RepID=A0A411E6V7_9FLAO|nr:hypothetical protein [Muriicola soli]QBA63253.1 hypothetical protein EQY75_01015 [Muriicola soli]
MKTPTFFSFFLFVTFISWSQEKAIKIINQETQKEIIIKNNKRVKIVTSEGQKITGRLAIADDTTIFVNKQQLVLSDIYEIKRNPLLTSILTSSVIIYAGALTTGFGVLIGVLVDSTAFWLTLPGAAMIYTGLKAPNFNRKFSKVKNWSFEIVSLSP